MSQFNHSRLESIHDEIKQEKIKNEGFPSQDGAPCYPDQSANDTVLVSNGDDSMNSEYSRWLSFQQQPPLPSQLVDANSSMQSIRPPPSQILSEGIPLAAAAVSQSSEHVFPKPRYTDPNFAKQANDLINEALGRTPGGTSVVEPDSVLGESGRLYHGYKEGSYFLPNDAAEQDRLDLQHHVYLLLLDGWLHLAPMTTVPKYVLDIATGTGIWAHDFAEKYPSSFVIGTDLSAIQPDPRVPNLVFLKDDAEAPWLFPAPHPPDANCAYPCEHRVKFDYVHLRMVVTCFDDTRKVMQQAFDNLNPGGWIEYQDVTFDIKEADQTEDSPLYKYTHGCQQGAATVGRDLLIAEKYKSYLEEIGFVDVQQREFCLPANPWPHDQKMKNLGIWQLRNCIDGLNAVGWKFLKLSGYSADEVETIIEEAIEYLRDVRKRPWTPVYIVYGRKPLI